MIKAVQILISSALIFLALAGCGEGSLYEKSYSFEDHSWELNETPSFDVDIQDTSIFYNINFTLRTTNDFEYSNLWVFLATTLPNGKIERKPYQFRITDEKGQWLGNNTGSVIETPLNFANMKLPQKGKYKFKIEQGVTIPSVKEVLDLSLSINPALQENK